MYQGENASQDKSSERKGIPAGSAPPPVNYNSYQSSQIQARKNTTSGELKMFKHALLSILALLMLQSILYTSVKQPVTIIIIPSLLFYVYYRILFIACAPFTASPSSFSSPAPMIRSKTSHGIGQQGGQVLSAPGSPMMPNATKPTRMIARSPSSAKEMLLLWVQQRVNTYPVTNFNNCIESFLDFNFSLIKFKLM